MAKQKRKRRWITIWGGMIVHDSEAKAKKFAEWCNRYGMNPLVRPLKASDLKGK